MVLHWRRCGRAGGRQITKRKTEEVQMDTKDENWYFTSDQRLEQEVLVSDD